MAVLYALLTLGGISMVFPFLLMISGGTKGPTDENDNRLIPAYMGEDYELFRKYVDDKYAGQIERTAEFYGLEEATRLLSTSSGGAKVKIKPLSEEAEAELERFLEQLPPDQWEAGFRLAQGRISSKLSTLYQEWVREKYGSIEAINVVYSEQNAVYQTLQPPAERYTSTRWSPRQDRKWRDWLEFKAALPPEYRIPVTVRGQWQQHLRSKYRNQLSLVPEGIRNGAQEFFVIEPSPESREFKEFYETVLPSRYRTSNPDKAWMELTGQALIPMPAYDSRFVATRAAELRRDFSSRNYRFVLDYILIHGRAIWNTVIFCFLAVLTQLIVNPLAAYALSRFALPATGKILLFLLATMAFPAEVTLIPSFLLLRDLGLLNTFAALVLPAAASGYSIYLLKGFFDSLPKDLYESAQIEGAKEMTMMFRITLPLSKPVLAVIALMAFMGAYGTFIYAFLVAQDERMWTLMVWIYQLQERAPRSTLMAALTIAALPTLIVFLLAQRVILRGIVVPGEK